MPSLVEIEDALSPVIYQRAGDPPTVQRIPAEAPLLSLPLVAHMHGVHVG